MLPEYKRQAPGKLMLEALNSALWAVKNRAMWSHSPREEDPKEDFRNVSEPQC